MHEKACLTTSNSPNARNCMSRSSFAKPKFIPPTGWTGHAPFAFWLVESLAPKTVVELGTHHGYSYFCVCQQVTALQLPSLCFAVDTWQGDEHAGLYGESVFE